MALIATLAVFFVPFSVEAAREEHPVVSGVRYISDTSASGAPIRIIVANPAQVRVLMEGPAGTSCTQNYNNTNFTNLDQDADFIAAINGLFIVDGKASGDYIGNKVFLGNATNQWYVAVNHQGRIQIGAGQLSTANKDNYSMFMRGGYRIGQPESKPFRDMTDSDVATRFASIYASHPENRTSAIARTFLGINETGNELLLMTGGAGENRNNGITPMEAVRYLKSLGATEAFVLDGGSSTFMRVQQRFNIPNSNSLPSGGGLDSLVVVRSGAPLTEAQTQALPVLQCRSNTAGANPANVGPTTASTTVSANTGAPAPITTVQQGTAPAISRAVPLEISINGISSITGEQNYILTYSRILFNFFAGLAGLLALLMLIVSGFQIMIGGTEQISKAKERIAGSIAGLLLLASSGFILYMINPCFFSFSASSSCTPRGVVGQEYSPPVGGGANSGTQSNLVPATPNRPRTPTQYANEKLSEAQSRWSQYAADFNGMRDIAFSGAPAEVFLGFASNGGITELTPGSSFRAMGMFGTETGPGTGSAPVAGGPDRWFPLSSDPLVVQFLGRNATTEPDAWKTAIRDQIAVGYVNIRNHGIGAMNALPANIRTTNYGSSWFVGVSFMAWSTGGGSAASIIAPFADRLAAVSENERWGTFVKLMAEAGSNGTVRPVATSDGHYDTHNNPFYSVVRTLQKLESGYLLAQRNGADVSFFAYPAGVDRTAVQQTLTNLGYYGVATR